MHLNTVTTPPPPPPPVNEIKHTTHTYKLHMAEVPHCEHVLLEAVQETHLVLAPYHSLVDTGRFEISVAIIQNLSYQN